MMKWLQRARGGFGIGLTWAVWWTPIGALTGWVVATRLGFPFPFVTRNYAVVFGMLGFIGGTIFSTVLAAAEGRRSFGQLSFRRFVGWGALGGFILGALATAAGLLGAGFSPLGAVIIGVSTALGASSAAGMLAIARGGRSPEVLVDAASRVR